MTQLFLRKTQLLLLTTLCLCCNLFAIDDSTHDLCNIHGTRINYAIGGHCPECLMSDTEEGSTDQTNNQTQQRTIPSDLEPQQLKTQKNDQVQNQDQESEERRLSITSNIFGNPDALLSSDSEQ